MYWNYIIIIFSFFSFLNFILLFFISAFLVGFRRDSASSFIAITELLGSLRGENKTEKIKGGKTWDQKYEEELERQRLLLRESRSGDL